MLLAPAIALTTLGPLGVVAALAALVAVALVQVRRRAKRRALKAPVGVGKAAGPMSCPSCLREFPQGTIYCPIDARKLVAADETHERRAPGMRCPRCRRAFEGGTRYCPLDAEELVPQAVWDATHGHEHTHGDDVDGQDGCGKICPVCASKYGLDASFCGKDGSELVTVN